MDTGQAAEYRQELMQADSLTGGQEGRLTDRQAGRQKPINSQ